MKKILAGSPVKQDPIVLKEFLLSLSELDKTSIKVDFIFVDDNHLQPAKDLLINFKSINENVKILPGQGIQDNYRNFMTHFWNDSLIWKVADYKNQIIKYFLRHDYDYLFLVDSDLILHPHTLKHLLECEKEIISEVYWTKWTLMQSEKPQVWMSDKYNFLTPEQMNNFTEKEHSELIEKFFAMLRVPGIYKVGGLGGCTLISRKVLEKGVSYKEIKNLSFQGEDRHFCVRATILDFELYADTHFPSLHLYRDSDLELISQFKSWAV